jgi:hypothetical protein
MVKTQLESTDLIPTGTRDSRYGGNYKPTMIKYSDLASQILSGVPPQNITVDVTPVIGGTVGKLMYEGLGNVVSETSLFNIDPSNGYLGVGTTTPYFPIDLKFNTLGFYSGPTYYAYLGLNNGSFYLTSYSDFVFGTSVVGNPLTIKQNGNVLINTGTDAGFKLDVNGTARVKTTDSSTPLNVAHSGAVGIQVEANSNGYRLRLASSNTNASITTPDSYLSINSGGQAVVIGSSSIFSGGFNGIASIRKDLSFADGGTYRNGQLAVGSITNNGAVVIGYSTTNIGFLQVAVMGASFSPLSLQPSGGNVLIGTTTDAGYKLDVVGIGRFGDFAGASSSVLLGQTTANAGYVMYGTGYVGNRAAYYFENANGGIIELAANNLTYNNRFRCGAQGNTGILIIGATGTASAGSSVVEMQSTTQGFLPPRMTSAQRTAIATPAVGLMVYQTDGTEGLYIYKSTGWVLNS